MTSTGDGVRGARWGLVENQILTEATRLFAERGFAATSLRDIADAAGMTRPALYHYFANKEGMLARLVSDLTLAPAAELGELGRLPGKSAGERLHAMVFATALRHARQPDRHDRPHDSLLRVETPVTATARSGAFGWG